MSSLFDDLRAQLGDDAVAQISRRIGADPTTTAQALPTALGSLMGAMAGNAQRPEGAAALLGALQRDHDGGILDDLGGFLSGGQTSAGEGILRHVLGGGRPAVEAGLGQKTGLQSQQMSQLLAMLAPIVMGALARKQRSSGLDAGALGEMLGRERVEVERRAPEGIGVLGGLLDRDGDGQVMDDVAKIGGGLLGSLLKRR